MALPQPGGNPPANPEGIESALPAVLRRHAARSAPPAAQKTPQAIVTVAGNPSTSGAVTHVWADSDNLAALARSCAMSSEELLKRNHLTRSELQEGQVLLLPRSDASTGTGADGEREAAQQLRREVWRGIRGRGQVALTFDAGGEDDAATDLLRYLKEENAPATFFSTGKFAADHQPLLKELSAASYPVHNHSWSHPEFTKIADEEIDKELERADWAIRDATGHSTKPYWRPPFGDRNTRVLRLAAAAGYQSIYWTLDSLDSVGDKKGPEFIVNRIMNPPRSNGDPDRYLDGAIILMHVGEPGTAKAVPEVIRALRQHGFKLVTVDDLLKP